MKITCQSCQSKYTVSDEKVQGRTVKIKCRKCGATILVNSSGAANGGVADAVSTASGPSDGSTYLVNVADGDQRSMSLADIVAGYNSALINADTYVWADGMSDWQPLGQVDAIVAALHSGGAPAAEAPAAAAPSPSYNPPAEQPSYGAPAAAAAGYGGAADAGYGAAAQPAYGAADPGYGAAAQPAYGAASPSQPAPANDPLGGIPRAAVRRDPARPSADLFGGGFAQEPQRPSSDDVATSAPLFSSSATPGKREENSMLFSLSALTAKAASPTASSSKTAATREDSGIIDLKALAAGEGGAASPVASIVPDDGGLFQLAAPIGAAATAPAYVAPIEAPPKNRGPIYIGVGIAVAGLAIAGAFFGMKGGGEQPTAATESPQTAAPATVAPPEPEPVQTAEPTPSVTASASASATAAPVAKGPIRKGPLPKSTGGTAKPGSTGGSAPASTAPKRGNCGCAAGDLMCAMQCSAKGK